MEQLRQTIDLDPTYWLAHDYLGRADEQNGDFAKAIEEFERARQLEDSIPENWTNLGHANALNGKREAAIQILAHVKEMSARTYVPPYNVASVYAALGDKDQSFAWIERAYSERSIYLTWMKSDSQLDGLRADPRFADLGKRVGLPQ
jgi:tetratricopeptide (TPR) repeat protein